MKFVEILKKRIVVKAIVGVIVSIATVYGFELFPGMNELIVNGICQAITCTP